jgi:hypothetical protein
MEVGFSITINVADFESSHASGAITRGKRAHPNGLKSSSSRRLFLRNVWIVLMCKQWCEVHQSRLTGRCAVDAGDQRSTLNQHVDAVLQCLYACALSRSIIVSSRNPDVCMMLSLKQPQYPVFFITSAGVLSALPCGSTAIACRNSRLRIRAANAWYICQQCLLPRARFRRLPAPRPALQLDTGRPSLRQRALLSWHVLVLAVRLVHLLLHAVPKKTMVLFCILHVPMLAGLIRRNHASVVDCARGTSALRDH